MLLDLVLGTVEGKSSVATCRDPGTPEEASKADRGKVEFFFLNSMCSKVPALGTLVHTLDSGVAL